MDSVLLMGVSPACTFAVEENGTPWNGSCALLRANLDTANSLTALVDIFEVPLRFYRRVGT